MQVIFSENWQIEFGNEFFSKEEDYPAAFNLYSSSNSLNAKENAYVQERMAWMYANGKGVDKNEKEAIKWYKTAAKHGSKTAEEPLRELEEKLATKEKFNKWMLEAEQYRPAAKEVCEKKEEPSQCITVTSCTVAALILENPHDDRIKKFKIRIKGNLFSKGSLSKAMEELLKQKDERLEKQMEAITMACAFF
jgi:TPR repeat protein